VTHTVPPPLVPARILNEHVYCPRLAYLEWVPAVRLVDYAATAAAAGAFPSCDFPSSPAR
jgi:hypothetical protein